MGIKVFCPSGHKLNVKTFLAGKTGICPHCAVRFSIPKEPGESRVQTEIAPERRKRRRRRRRKSSAAAAGGPMLVTTPVSVEGVGAAVNPVAASFIPAGLPQTGPDVPTTPVSSPAGTLVDPIAEAPAARWYVQSTTGGRYGPAPGDMMRTWLAEGRVAADSLVWREGWAQWQTASTVFPQLGQPQGGGKSGPQLPIDWSGEIAAPKESAIAVSGKLKVSRRSNRMVATVIALLVVVVLLLAIAFVIIMTREEPAATSRHPSRLPAVATPSMLFDFPTA